MLTVNQINQPHFYYCYVTIDKRPVVRKIDKTTQDNVAALSEAFLTYMKEFRYPDEPATKKGHKRKVTND